MRVGKTLAVMALAAAAVYSVAEAPVRLVKDFIANDAVAVPVQPFAISELAPNTQMYLEIGATDGLSLWRKDASGAQLLRAFGALPNGRQTNQVSLPGAFVSINGFVGNTALTIYNVGAQGAVIGGRYVFAGSESGVAGVETELWSSDGTSAGTTLLKDLRPGAGSSEPSEFVVFNGLLHFSATRVNAQGDQEAVLWRTDGTAAGTQEVYVEAGFFPRFANLQVANGRLFFTRTTSAGFPGGFGPTGLTALSTDGTAAGTYPLIGANSTPAFLYSRLFAADTGDVFFCEASDGGLYRTRGAEGDVELVLAKPEQGGGFPGSPGFNPSYCLGVLADGPQGTLIAVKDGSTLKLVLTQSGSRIELAQNIGPTTQSVRYGGVDYFLAGSEPGGNPGLYAFNATDGSLNRVVGFEALQFDAFPHASPYLQVRNGQLQYLNADSSLSPGLYAFNGTGSPSLLSNDETQFVQSAGVQDIAPVYPRPVLARHGDAVLPASDLSQPGAVLAKLGNLVTGVANSDEVEGDGTFITDGSLRNTRFIREAGAVQDRISLPEGVLQAIRNSDTDFSLEWIDLTGAITTVARYRETGSSGAPPAPGPAPMGGPSFPPPFAFPAFLGSLTTAGGQVFFIAPRVEQNGEESRFNGLTLSVWQPGSAPRELKAFGVDFNGQFLGGLELQAAGGKVFFAATDPEANQEMAFFNSDGTVAGTQRIAAIPQNNLGLNFIGAAGERAIASLFLDDNAGGRRRVLLAMDGSIGHLEQLADVASTATGDDAGTAMFLGNGARGAAVNDQLIFAFRTADEGFELWKTDGSTAGTHMLRALRAGPVGGNPDQFTAAGAAVYFAANGEEGRELWVTDGSTAGTRQVTNLVAGLSGSNPHDLSWQADLNKLVFAATADGHGSELFATDGSSTELLASINPGLSHSTPYGIQRAGPQLLMLADDGKVGNELFTVALENLPPAAPALVANAVRVNESDVQGGKLRVFLDPASDQTVTVNYSLRAGTAIDGVDFTAASGSLSFAPGETEKQIPLGVIADERVESDETFFVDFSAATGAELVNSTATVTIVDDEFGSSFRWELAMNGEFVLLVTDEGVFADAAFVPAPAEAPAEFEYPYGFLHVDIVKTEDGADANVQMFFGSERGIDTYVKCGLETCGAFPNVSFAPDNLVLTLTDGGLGDLEGMANGNIRDPGAPAIAARLLPFSFIERGNIAANRVITSEAVNVPGTSAGASGNIRIENGQYQINSQPWTSAAGVLRAGDRIALRHTSARAPSTATHTLLHVGDAFTVQFTSVTSSADRAPDAFTFVSQSNVAASSLVLSNTLTLTGYNVAVQVSPAGGLEYRINGGSFTGAKGTMRPGDRLQVRHTASSAKAGYKKSSIKVGETTGTFTTRTR